MHKDEKLIRAQEIVSRANSDLNKIDLKQSSLVEQLHKQADNSSIEINRNLIETL